MDVSQQAQERAVALVTANIAARNGDPSAADVYHELRMTWDVEDEHLVDDLVQFVGSFVSMNAMLAQDGPISPLEYWQGIAQQIASGGASDPR